MALITPPPSSAEVKERVELYLYTPLWVNFTFTSSLLGCDTMPLGGWFINTAVITSDLMLFKHEFALWFMAHRGRTVVWGTAVLIIQLYKI